MAGPAWNPGKNDLRGRATDILSRVKSEMQLR